MMDMEDFFILLFHIVVGSIVGLCVLAFLSWVLVDGIFFDPIRAEDAQRQCEEKGYDIYTEYRGVYRIKAHGVKCGYVDFTRKQIDVNTEDEGGQPILVVS